MSLHDFLLLFRYFNTCHCICCSCYIISIVHLLVCKTGNGAKSKDNDDLINKLTKENKELNVKLETYMEEMEELDIKNEQLENANKEFQKNFERVKSIELVGSNLTELAALETEKEEVEQKLKKEISKRETVEIELFKLEEEYESYKIAQEESDEKLEAEINKINQDLYGRKVPLEVINEQSATDDLKPTSGVEMALRFLLKKKQKQLVVLEKENEMLKQQIKSLEQVSKFTVFSSILFIIIKNPSVYI